MLSIRYKGRQKEDVGVVERGRMKKGQTKDESRMEGRGE